EAHVARMVIVTHHRCNRGQEIRVDSPLDRSRVGEALWILVAVLGNYSKCPGESSKRATAERFDEFGVCRFRRERRVHWRAQRDDVAAPGGLLQAQRFEELQRLLRPPPATEGRLRGTRRRGQRARCDEILCGSKEASASVQRN